MKSFAVSISFFFQLAFLSLCFSQQTIYSAVKNFQSKEFLQDGAIGIQIVDLSSNEVLSAVNANKVMPTASTTKLFSTAYALEQLGPEYRSKTILGHNGTIKGKTLNGDLIVQMNGELTLGSKYFAEHKDSFMIVWADTLRKLGIEQIQGKLIIDGSTFGYEGSPADWQWGDLGNAYGAHFSGVNLYDNIVLYTFKTGKAGTTSELLYTTPSLPIRFDNRISAGKVNGDQSSIFGAAYAWDRSGTGQLPELKNNYTVRGSLPDPEEALAIILAEYLQKNGIAISGHTTTRIVKEFAPLTDTLFVYEGHKLLDILKVTNYESVNLFAEGVMRIAAWEKEGENLHNDASTAMETFWRKSLNTKSLILNDGSGLARTNCISAKILTDLLIYMQNAKFKDEFYSTLPQAGLHGTLKSVSKNKPAQGVMRAKSGTMRRVKSYAGYVDSKSGRRLAFAVIVNYHTCTNKELVTAMEEIFDAMANY